jgi:hypothetical protein
MERIFFHSQNHDNLPAEAAAQAGPDFFGRIMVISED